jgi:hypothetical protein
MNRKIDEEFNKEDMLKINYTFEVNVNVANETLEGKIYKITDEYRKLDKRGKTLINDIIRYCDENNKFPNEKDMTNKKGYISRTQYYKYFNINNFSEVYKYIIPIDLGNKGGGKTRLVEVEKIKPTTAICIKCGKEKPFTQEYFRAGKNNKYGLKYECHECMSQESVRKFYENKGIYYVNIEDISIEDWYEYYLSSEDQRYMPKHCYNKDNLIAILKYVIQKKENLNSKSDILEKFNTSIINKYKLSSIVNKLGGKLNSLNLTFPEFGLNIENKPIRKYFDNSISENIIQRWIDESNYTVLDMLTQSSKKILSNEMKSMLGNMKKNYADVLIEYFNKKDILHPLYNRVIEKYDFLCLQDGYWNDKENRILRIRKYCESDCEINIINVIEDTDKLKLWIFNNFKSENISKIIGSYGKYGSLYDILIEAYPQILENKILFDWEWHQFNKNDKETLIRELKEFILYRMNGVIKNIYEDVPKYINLSNIENIFSKLNKQIDKKRFSSYYEWCCLAFPEYKDKWTKQDFGHIISYDGIEFDSYQEKDIYELIKNEEVLKYIKPTGKHKKGKYTFDLGDDYEYERFCPDFVIEEINLKGNKRKLQKPIIVEFYGMYVENHNHKIYQNYYKKTLVKDEFYKNNKDIYYIGIFPDDIKNNYEGLKQKLEAFFMFNFNIDIKKVA